jgi:hypothetical protein
LGKYIVRNFVDGDEKRIVELFNRVFGNFSGYVPRTVEYWRWCCLERPDVRRDGIFLLFDEESGNLEGYVVAGLSGNIWEFCCIPSLDVALFLLDRAIRYLEDMGVSAVNVNVPEGCDVLNEACRKAGFARVDVHKMFVGVLSFSKLFSILIEDRKNFLCNRFEEKFCVMIRDAPFWVEKALSIDINREGVNVFEGSIDSPTVSVKTDVKTLSSVLFGVMNPVHAVLRFKMRVKPFWKTPRFVEFLDSVRLRDAWFWPLGDFG